MQPNMTEPLIAESQRRAAFKEAAMSRKLSQNRAARDLGVSYNHLMLVFRGRRQGSQRLRAKVAEFLGRSEPEVFGDAFHIRAL
jgi:transcriptional regulator with XRE-family HTH domain